MQDFQFHYVCNIHLFLWAEMFFFQCKYILNLLFNQVDFTQPCMLSVAYANTTLITKIKVFLCQKTRYGVEKHEKMSKRGGKTWFSKSRHGVGKTGKFDKKNKSFDINYCSICFEQLGVSKHFKLTTRCIQHVSLRECGEMCFTKFCFTKTIILLKN